MRFEELPDRDAAEAARGILLFATVDVAESPEDPEEFYAHQLVGLAAYDEQGAHLGEVSALVRGGAQDLLTVRTPDGREALVPFVKALVPEVDLAGGRVVIADRPGLVTPLEEVGPMRIDVVTIFPRVPRPARPLAAGQGPREGPPRPPRPRPAGTGRTTGTAPSTTRRTAAGPGW